MFWSRSTGGMAALSALLPLVLGSCVEDSVSLRITCSLVPDADCTFDTGGSCYLGGALNLADGAVTSYYSVLRVTNGLKPRAGDIPPQSEPNGVTINQVEVEITDSAGNKPSFPSGLPNPFTVQATGYADPGESAPVGAELLPTAYVGALRQLYSAGKLTSVRLSVIARGKTDGRHTVASAGWPWNIQLVRVSLDPADQRCQPVEDTVCALGQDQWAGACDPALTEN
jgi:hypothetical protein